MSRTLLILSVCLALLLASTPGSAQWTEEGALVRENVVYTFQPDALVQDGAGGMYVFFRDNLVLGDAHTDIYVTRINAHGLPVWPSPVAVLESPGHDAPYDACSDGAGGAIVIFLAASLPSGGGMWAQRIAPDGTLLFPGTGTMIYTDPTELVLAVPDGAGGAVIVYEELPGGGDYNLLAQRVSDTGGILWTAGGVTVSTLTNDQGLPKVAANPLGGVVVVWSGDRGGGSDIYGQYLAADGSKNWFADGQNLSGNSVSSGPDVACFGNGAVAVAWFDSRNSPDKNIGAQYVTANGSPYMPGGTLISDTAISHSQPTVHADGLGGVLFGWRDDSTGQMEAWGQRYESFAPVWNGGSPMLMSLGAGNVNWPEFMADGGGALIAVYQRYSHEGWGQRIGPYGDWGLPSGEVSAIEDVPADEGGWVRIRLSPSRLEDGSGGLGIEGYNVWRLAGDGAKAVSQVPTRDELMSGAFVGRAVGAEVAKALNLPAGTWESVGYHPAVGLVEYLLLAPTRADSAAAGPARETFCITTHTDMAGVVYASLPDSGSSVDNLAPDPPKDLGGSADWDAGGVSLQWDGGKSVDDVEGYNVYRGTTVGFPVGPAHLLDSTANTWYFDDSPPVSPHYKVTAFDRHGNESVAAVLSPLDISGIDTPTAYRNRLAQNRPNPFNPQTIIVYELKDTGPVWLRVHDLSGRLVRTLVAGTVVEQGVQQVVWQGEDDMGRAVAAGVYVYRLNTPEFTAARRMALIR